MEKPWLKSYPSFVPAEIETDSQRTICDLIESSFEKYPDHPAFSNFGKTISFTELDHLSQKVASFLQNQLGLKKGDRVAIMLPNVMQFPVALFGILRAGCVAVNVNPLYTARELEHQLSDSGAETIFILANAGDRLEKVLSSTPIKNIVVTEVGDMLDFPKSFLINAVIKHVKRMVPKFKLNGAWTFSKMLKASDEKRFQKVAVSSEDLAFLQYTGGTTGLAKGAMLTHSNISSNVAQATAWIRDCVKEGDEIMITALPLYHIFSLTANCFTFSSLGGLNVLITNPRDIPGFIKELRKWKFTSITGVNTLFKAMLANAGFWDLDFSNLRTSLAGGMSLQENVAKDWKEATGVILTEAYGLTETSPAACMNPIGGDVFNGFIGLPISSTIVSIKDNEKNDLPIGEVGEVCIKGPQVMKGYWEKADETSQAFSKDGYFCTGDVGFMTEDGYVKLVDRKKDMILVSGFNVYPNEVEDVACLHEKVFEAAAVGVPDEKSGEVVKLFVVKKVESLTEEELQAYCKEKLAAYKRPRIIEFRDTLPKSNIGKILRRELR